MNNAGCERKATPLEVLDETLRILGEISREIKTTSGTISDNLFGQLSKPCSEGMVKDSVCSGSIGAFISSVEYSLEVLKDTLDTLRDLRLRTAVDRPNAPTMAPKTPYNTEKVCGCEKLGRG